MQTTSSTVPLVLFSIALLGCDAGKNPLGSLDGASDDTGGPATSSGPEASDLDTGSADACVQPGASAEFEVVGLGGGIHDLDLDCAASVSTGPGGYTIALSGCSDGHPDLEIHLTGSEWSEPIIDDQAAVELRYLEMPISVVIDGVSTEWGVGRWLILRNPGAPLPLPLVAVDALAVDPGALGFEYDVDYAPLVLDVESAGCGLLEHPECGAIEPLAVVVDVEGEEPVVVPEGGESFEVHAGSVGFHVLVQRTREFVDCPRFPGEYQFGIVALPSG